jgi:hypothetical protein
MDKRHKCPCCEYFTLIDQPGLYEICPVCFWMDDPLQFADPDCIRPTNRISLKEARSNYLSYGAIDKMYLDSVRQPRDFEKNEAS